MEILNATRWRAVIALVLLLAQTLAVPAQAQQAATQMQAQAAAVPAEQPPVWQDAKQWKSRLDLAAQRLAPTTGAWVEREILPATTWLQVLLGGLIVIAVAAVERTLHASLRRRIRNQVAPDGGQESWFKSVQQALLAPLTLLIWVWGSFAALTIMLAGIALGAPLLQAALDWFLRIGNFAALFWLIVRLADVVEVQLQGWAARSESNWDNILAILASRALRWIAPLFAVILLLPSLDLGPGSRAVVGQGTSVALIIASGVVLAQLVGALEDGVTRRYRLDVRDNLAARRVRTQALVLKKIALVVIGVATLALSLMVFPSVRHLGASLLASAGLAGIIMGFAAQRSLGTLIAGLQIAITQPIRVDDVVIVENEWGRVEEISLSYVVVRLWDLRRLVVPTSYFLEKPFQNWTRVSAELLGTVMLHVDYTVPLKALREELDRILAQSPLWNGKVKVLQVTDAREQTLELRVLVSAADAGSAFDLRCQVREALVDFLQRNYPQALPRLRAELDTGMAAVDRRGPAESARQDDHLASRDSSAPRRSSSSSV